MDVVELFRGIAVVIDDEINDGDTNIRSILEQINEKNIPCLAYSSLPAEDVIPSLHHLAFLLLDWRLIKNDVASADILAGIQIPSTLLESQVVENVEFLKKIANVCFCPIFIFSNEDQTQIVDRLIEEGIYSSDKPNHIFVKSKNELLGEKRLFNEIEEWIKLNPSIYVLKEWEKEYQRSKNQLFADFQQLSPLWPKIMWETYSDDGANKSLELGGLISRNILNRMMPFEFSNEIIGAEGSDIDEVDIRRVLEGERFLNNKYLHEDDISTGDVFKEVYTDDAGVQRYRYYLNIRAQCDLLRENNIGDVELYCLKGRLVQEKSVNKEDDSIRFLPQFGQFIEKVSHAVIPFLDEGGIIEFLFKDLKIIKWKALKDKRVGRLLPPYINSVQQRYTLYLQRQGLPRVPKIIAFDKD